MSPSSSLYAYVSKELQWKDAIKKPTIRVMHVVQFFIICACLQGTVVFEKWRWPLDTVRPQASRLTNKPGSCWIPRPWMYQGRTTQLLSPHSPGIPYFPMVLKMDCASRTLLEYKTPESNNPTTSLVGKSFNFNGI